MFLRKDLIVCLFFYFSSFLPLILNVNILLWKWKDTTFHLDYMGFFYVQCVTKFDRKSIDFGVDIFFLHYIVNKLILYYCKIIIYFYLWEWLFKCSFPPAEQIPVCHILFAGSLCYWRYSEGSTKDNLYSDCIFLLLFIFLWSWYTQCTQAGTVYLYSERDVF